MIKQCVALRGTAENVEKGGRHRGGSEAVRSNQNETFHWLGRNRVDLDEGQERNSECTDYRK